MDRNLEFLLTSRVGHLILRALAIRASNFQNALARIGFLSPKSLTPPPPPPLYGIAVPEDALRSSRDTELTLLCS